MTADPSSAAGRPVRLGDALVASVRLLFEWAVPLVVANVAWGVVVTIYAVLLIGVPAGILAVPLLALPTASLTRLAVAAVRSGVPSLAMARDELGRLPLRKVGLAGVQLAVMGIALANVGLAGRIGGPAGVISGGVAIWAAVLAAVYGVALWPIVCDPLRAGPLRDQLRLALALTVRRPLQLVVLAVVAGLAVAVSVRFVLPASFLPALTLLAIAGYVVPAADEIAPPEQDG